MANNKNIPDNDIDLNDEDPQGFENTHEMRRRNARNAGRQFREKLAEADAAQEREPLLSPAVKGIIGILVSTAFVALVILIFAKVLFLHETSGADKTGTITVTSATGTTPVTTTGLNERVSKTTKEKVRYNVDSSAASGTQKEQSKQKIKCISPVLVHPEPNSSSANLTTVPLNAEVDFIKDENGWYYITYNGITGYAWGQFFESPQSAQQQY
ncbi:MAG: SH3 domain-containing protein [Ruminococcus sp.]|nr:SH3 domain-containing protein [Ruminococcus sp.]